MKKIPSLFLFLLIGYVLPLAWRPALILHPFVLILMGACAIVLLTQPDADPEELKTYAHTDRNSYWFIYLFAVIGIIAPLIEWAYLQPLHNRFNVISLLGLVIIAGGLALRVWSIQVLGKFFTATVQIQNGHQLIRKGPYLILRHPSYTGAYLAYIGSALLLNAYWGAIIAGLAMGIAYIYRIQTEERALLTQFGELYEQYRRETYCMVPWVW